MSAKATSQVQCHAQFRDRWIHKPIVSRDEERIRFRQRREALLVLDIPTDSLIFTAIFAAHGDPFLTMERRASPPGWTGEGARPSIESLVAYGWRRGKPRLYCSFAYSALASWSSGRSGSASFQTAKKFWYA